MEIGTKHIKRNWKFRLIFALITGFIFSLLLYLQHLILGEEVKNIYSYIFQGVFFGIFFELTFPTIIIKLGKKLSSLSEKLKPKLIEGEVIESHGSANLFRGFESVGGILFMTNKRLIFNSHKFNLQTGQTSIDYSEIKEITGRKTAKLFNNGVRIIDSNGKKYDFVVNEREIWIEQINQRMKR